MSNDKYEETSESLWEVAGKINFGAKYFEMDALYLYIVRISGGEFLKLEGADIHWFTPYINESVG